MPKTKWLKWISQLKPQLSSLVWQRRTKAMKIGCNTMAKSTKPILHAIHTMAPTSLPMVTHTPQAGSCTHASHWWCSTLEAWHNVFWLSATKKHSPRARGKAIGTIVVSITSHCQRKSKTHWLPFWGSFRLQLVKQSWWNYGLYGIHPLATRFSGRIRKNRNVVCLESQRVSSSMNSRSGHWHILSPMAGSSLTWSAQLGQWYNLLTSTSWSPVEARAGALAPIGLGKTSSFDKKLMMSAISGSLAMADHWREKSWWCPAIGGQKAANLMCSFVWVLHWFCTGTLPDKERGVIEPFQGLSSWLSVKSPTFLSLSFHTTECAQRKTGNRNPYHFLQLCNSTGNSIQTNQICWSHMLLSRATGATNLKKALKECVLCVMLDSFPKVILEAQDQTNWQTRIM